MEHQSELRIPALEICQRKNRRLYSFAVDGKLLPQFTTVSRIRRENGGDIQGYQRPEVISHISEIRNYLESENPMIPNALVVSFDQRVRFEPTKENGSNGDGYSQHGTLVIPLDEQQADADKPGWMVDGQQRMAAIRDARIDSFPICVTAFIAGSDREQRGRRAGPRVQRDGAQASAQVGPQWRKRQPPWARERAFVKATRRPR